MSGDDWLWLDEIVEKALQQDRDVLIEAANGYGFHIVVDGVPVTESERAPEKDEGLPWEGLEYPLVRGGRTSSSDQALEKAREIVGDE
ncbi:hypothetical protein HTZ84_20935 [Haloterrigena sp. SYSU A558-1]|uniref:Uncharacterized protein n=1 Tax=Haloterrigena gelatinilytica TaxID=2741724 RepID=A0ABX2LJI7_9EURY|nr:hypothetical protein [Haloterrigena gelatinilytica]NUC74730.1 hypothetical protein [Haloterrigena gelatinilytica]